MMVRGSVDVVTSTEVRGWAFSPGRREPVLVQAVLNHEILGEATAAIHRPDLAAAGVGDGNSGYSIPLFRPIDPLYLPFLVVKVDGGDTELPRAPMLGFGEFFTSLYAKHPTAGRHRCVFGGLWTDRTDAAALLRGKIAIGQIAPQAATVLADLIHGGFAILDISKRLTDGIVTDTLAERVGDIVEYPAVLTVLRAILEDNPIVVTVAWAGAGEAALGQPSARNPSPSPAECVEIIVPVGEDVALDIVRDSHVLPEFTPHGVSRWASGAAGDGVSLAAASGLLDRHSLAAGTAAIIGPGTLYRVSCAAGQAAGRILCLPERGLPLTLATEAGRTESKRASGVRLWL